MEFNFEDILLQKKDKRKVYHRRTNTEKTAIPWGQRKLLLSEITFLTLYLDLEKIPNPKIVYAGAAPGKHFSKLSEMFPECEFFLWDPANFHLKETDKIHIFQEYFTNKTAKKWENRDDVYFISDIRTGDYTTAPNPVENEKNIMKDMYMQQEWHEIIKPIKSLLKFRLPYSGLGLDSHMKYLDGVVYKQQWAPQTSTETRLVPHTPIIYKEWDSIEYEEQLFHFNTEIREHDRFRNIFDPKNPNKAINEELSNEYDSMAEVYILSRYLLFSGKEPTKELVVNLSQSITDSINMGKSFSDTLAKLRIDRKRIKTRNDKNHKKRTKSKKLPKNGKNGENCKNGENGKVYNKHGKLKRKFIFTHEK